MIFARSIRVVGRRLISLFQRKRLDAELDNELAFHFAQLVKENVVAGMSVEEARHAAQRTLGNVSLLEEQCRDERRVTWVDDFLKDVVYAWRLLLESRAFTFVVVGSLGLGIGANAAIFTLIDAVMLKMLPVKNPEQLMLLRWFAHDGTMPVMRWHDGYSWTESGLATSPDFSFPTFEQIHSHNQVFTSVFAFKELGRLNVVANGDPGLVSGQLVSGNYFSGLGLSGIIGRTITESDDKPGAPPVAVIGYDYWQGKFGGSRDIVGKAVTVNGVPFTIIGVTPAEFFGLSPGTSVQISLPLRLQPLLEPHWVKPGTSLFTAADHWWLNVMGRLKPGVTEEQARAGLEVIFNQSVIEGVTFKRGQPRNIPWLAMTAGSTGLASLRREFSKPLFILMAVVGLALLVACANVANLQLARATARQREIAVRLSLGAGRLRLIRQFLTESLLLSSLGGLFGLIVAYWGSYLLLALLSRTDNPIVLDISIDTRVLGFTAAACIVTGLLFGLAPALKGTRIDLTPSLKAYGGSRGAGRLRMPGAKPLVITQVALSLVLLIGAGLFVRTLMNLKGVNAGFNPDNLLLFGIDPTQKGYTGTRLANFYERVQEHIERLPGVRSATLSLHLLLSGSARRDDISVPGYTPRSSEDSGVYVLPVGAQFFGTMEIPLLAGRSLDLHDAEKSQKVAVVNETLVKHYFAQQNPLGKQFSLNGSPLEIVGVVKDAKYRNLRNDTPATVYLPFRQILDSIGAMHFEVRTSGDPRAMVPTIQHVIHEFDRELPLYDLKTQTKQVDEILLQERLFAKLSALFAFLALLLSCMGLYGTLAYGVVQRTKEIGIRMAVGAQRSEVLWMILKESLILIFAGAIVGVPAALGATRFIASRLYDVKPNDAATIAGTVLIMAVIGAAAGYLPALRASKVDPMTALRHE